MNSANLDRLQQIARNVNWFEPPEQLVAKPNKFLCYAMTYGMLDDINFLLQHYGNGPFREALMSVYARIIDERSKAYFELICGQKQGDSPSHN